MPDTSARDRPSARIIIEGLILAAITGLVWLGFGMYHTQGAQAVAMGAMSAQLGYMRDEITSLRTQLADIPALSRAITKVEVRVDEHERRINEIEQVKRLR